MPATADDVSSRARRALLWVAALTGMMHLVPLGGWVIWPLTLFSTFAHEIGHGLAALMVGGQFESFQMWADGSGLTRAKYAGHLASAVVSAGGLVGPALLALVLFVVARRRFAARMTLYTGAAAIAFLDVAFVRNAFGFAFVGGCALVCGVLARKLSAAGAQVAVVFVAVQLALSVFSRSDYLFTDVAVTSGGSIPSDSAQMAAHLGGPYWLWGGLVGLFSAGVLLLGLLFFLRGTSRSAPTPHVQNRILES
jgi:hypothetical protein